MFKKRVLFAQREMVDLLLQKGYITEPMLQRAREEMSKNGLSLEKALQNLGIIVEEDMVSIKAESMDVPYLNLSDYNIDQTLIKLIPEAAAKKYQIVPLFKIKNVLTVGMVNPKDVMALDHIRKISGLDMIEPVMVSEPGWQLTLDAHYGVIESIEEIVKAVDQEAIAADKNKEMIGASEGETIVRLVNMLLKQSVRDRVSDIHIEPEEDNLRVRVRIDGILHEMTILPKKLQSAVISRIKILANMDIAETRKPQDGRIRQKIENKDLDIRVSSFPTIHGENVVMRLLDKSSILLGLKDLGFWERDLELINKLIGMPNGIILVTGPTGSGKTSTLYAALASINTVTKNIITIEDPVEYEIPLIRQTQINPKAGITFSNGLRSILRQDPDIIMVGEIRDKETVEIAIQAALTGHLVFSTLHTNDASSALTRLIDMDVEPLLISTSVKGIIAQRLVRVICEKCKEEYTPSNEVLRDLGIKTDVKFYHGKGCPKCKDTGFMGRLGIGEVLIITEEIRRMIDARSSVDQIKKAAVELGMKTLREDGLLKAQKGLTTPEEVLHVTVAEQ